MKNIIPILFVCFLLQTNLFAQQSFRAKVVSVVDGDTLIVLTNDKRQLAIRLNGIDAPEKDQDFGIVASAFLIDLVLNKTVSVSDYKKDCHDRFTASISFKNKDLSRSAVESGNAWADSTCQTDEMLVKAEISARERKIGLWQNPNPIRPAVFLKSRQEAAQAQNSQPQTNQTQTRRIFAGLEPKQSGGVFRVYMGMTLNDFIETCGQNGKASKTLTSIEGIQTFSVDMLATEDNASKGCGGNFTFQRTVRKPIFILTSVYQ